MIDACQVQIQLLPLQIDKFSSGYIRKFLLERISSPRRRGEIKSHNFFFKLTTNYRRLYLPFFFFFFFWLVILHSMIFKKLKK